MNYSGSVYANNTDLAYFQFDYQSVLDRINKAMEECLISATRRGAADAPMNPIPLEDIPRTIFFKVVEGKIHLYVSREIIQRRILFRFSGNLYKYIGNGFQCRFYNNALADRLNDADENPDGSFFIDYNPFAWRHPSNVDEAAEQDERRVVTDTNVWGNGYIRNEDAYISSICDSINEESFTYPGAPGEEDEEKSICYYIFKQQYSTLPNWNACKAILICSSSFPIKAEYYLTTQRTCSSRTTRIRGTLG